MHLKWHNFQIYFSIIQPEKHIVRDVQLVSYKSLKQLLLSSRVVDIWPYASTKEMRAACCWLIPTWGYTIGHHFLLTTPRNAASFSWWRKNMQIITHLHYYSGCELHATEQYPMPFCEDNLPYQYGIPSHLILKNTMCMISNTK